MVAMTRRGVRGSLADGRDLSPLLIVLQSLRRAFSMQDKIFIVLVYNDFIANLSWAEVSGSHAKRVIYNRCLNMTLFSVSDIFY